MGVQMCRGDGSLAMGVYLETHHPVSTPVDQTILADYYQQEIISKINITS